jgi:hypothetical protein
VKQGISTRIALVAIAATAFVLALGASASSAPLTPAARAVASYGWPVAPFDQAHPVRAMVGDPRTLFKSTSHRHALSGPGLFSFHDGVDIDARSGTAVYPVVSGVARVAGDGVVVQAHDGRLFMYKHIAPAVRSGQRVTARQTVLGHVENWAEVIHFSELTGDGRVVNPLLPGHLTPYADTTDPTVARLHFRGVSGGAVDSFDLRGRITLIAEAYDTPMPLDHETRRALRLTKFARDRFPVTPASLTWSLATLGGRVVVPPTTVMDFRVAARWPNEAFWSVYARGTFQNRAVITARLHSYMPGRYLFRLTRAPLDTRRLANGVYVAKVTAVDARGNRSSLSERIEIWNAGNKR